MKNLLLKNRIWILGLSYVGAIFLFVVYFLFPNVNRIEEQANSIQEKILDKKILENRISQLPEMKEQADVFLQNREGLGKTVRSSEEVIFIQYLEELASETGNQINIEIPDDQVEDKSSTKKTTKKPREGEILSQLKYKDFLIMNITLLGNFQEAFNFIKKIENFQYYSNVISIDMEKIEKETISSRDQSIFLFSEEGDDLLKEYLKTTLKLVVYKNGSEN